MLKELNQVMDYIEDHLTDEDLSLDKISSFAGVSDYHFRQIFYHLIGYTLSEYVKGRRLSEASEDLLQGAHVTEVSYRYGYQSLDGFTRAFKKWSGSLPSEVQKSGRGFSFQRISFVIKVQGGTKMEYKIIEKPAFYFAGVSRRVPMQFEGVNEEIVNLAKSITKEQREELHRLKNVEPKEIINASYEADYHFEKEEGHLTHLIGVLTTEETAGEGLELIPVPEASWAVFPNEGPFPKTLQDTMARIYSEWLPASSYELLPLPFFSFTKMTNDLQDVSYSEIWIPVKRIE